MRLDTFVNVLFGEQAVDALDKAGVALDGTIEVVSRRKSVSLGGARRINVTVPVVETETRHRSGTTRYTVRREAEVWDEADERAMRPTRPYRRGEPRRRILGADIGVVTTELPADAKPVEARISWMGHTGED